jgi:hypothetical protein
MKNVALLPLLLGLTVLSACDKPAHHGAPATVAECDCKVDQCVSMKDANKPVALTGTLGIGTYNIGGKAYKPYMVALDRWLCVSGDPSLPQGTPEKYDAKPMHEIQLAGPFDPKQILEQYGRHVEVTGMMYGATTVFQVTPVFLYFTGIKPL